MSSKEQQWYLKRSLVHLHMNLQQERDILSHINVHLRLLQVEGELNDRNSDDMDVFAGSLREQSSNATTKHHTRYIATGTYEHSIINKKSVRKD